MRPLTADEGLHAVLITCPKTDTLIPTGLRVGDWSVRVLRNCSCGGTHRWTASDAAVVAD